MIGKAYLTTKPLDYDWIKIPVGTRVKLTEEWRPHNVFKFIAFCELPDGILCPMFFDEVEEEPKKEEESV